MRQEEGTILTTVFNPRNSFSFTVTTDIKDDSIFKVDNQSVFEDAVDSVYFPQEPENRDETVKSALKDVIKANYTKDIKQVAINVKKRNAVKTKVTSLRM